MENPKKKRYSLADLFIIKETELCIDDDITWLLEFNSKDFTDVDVALANFNMLKYKDIKKQNSILTDITTSIKPITKIEIIDNTIIFDYTDLKSKCLIDEKHTKETIKSFIKFIKIENFNSEQIYNNFIEQGFDITHFDILKEVCSYWVSTLSKTIDDNIINILELKDDKSTYYNSAMLDLQITYEHLSSCYFSENLNKAYSEWSFREKLLSRGYFTKKYMIDKAVDDSIKSTYDKGKNAKVRKLGQEY